jgi:osmotically-inducible protein OsmY
MRQVGRFLSVFFLAMAVLSVLGCASTSTSQAPGEYLDDSVITAKVKTAIFNDPDLKVMEISVETFRGDVQLSGFVSSRAAANRAVEVAKGVGGVKSVKDDMQIKDE